MPFDKFSISLPQSTVAAIQERGDERSTTINKSLERYLYLLDRARRDLVDQFSDNEMAMILDVLNGTGFFEPFSVQILPADIEDSIQDGYAEKWNIDGRALAEKLKALDIWHIMALVDCVERWWNRVGNGEQPPFSDALKK